MNGGGGVWRSMKCVEELGSVWKDVVICLGSAISGEILQSQVLQSQVRLDGDIDDKTNRLVVFARLTTSNLIWFNPVQTGPVWSMLVQAGPSWPTILPEALANPNKSLWA